MLFHSCSGCLGVLGSRHPLATLLSSLDVHRDHCFDSPPEPLGIFHRHLRRRPLGLRKYCCDDFLLQRFATALAMGSHRPSSAAGLAHRRSRLVFEAGGRYRLLVGLFASITKTFWRCRQIPADICPHDRLFCVGYVFIPAPLSRPISANAAPALALTRTHYAKAFASRMSAAHAIITLLRKRLAAIVNKVAPRMQSARPSVQR